MSKDPDAIRKYIQLLGNPYAKEQLDIGPAEQKDLVFRPLTDAERDYVRKLENPYAPLSVGIDDGKGKPAVPRATAGSRERSSSGKLTLSKDDFDAECRRIFGLYIPAAEKGRLRRHHRDFITRNQNQSPMVRRALVTELRKYDISAHSGIAAQFNRERDVFTEQKLKQIERSILNKDGQ